MYTPVAIYAWENEKCKNIPCIENFDTLSKLYKCHVEDLLILAVYKFDKYVGAVQKEMGSPNYFKFTREFKSAKI